MSLFDTLTTARSGMQAAQIGISVTANNIANASTEGYSRQAVDLGSAGTLSTRGLLLGQGVTAGQVIRAFDAFTESRLAGERAGLSYASGLSTAYASMEALFEDGSETGLPALLSGFFDAFASLSSAPDDAAWREEALAAAGELAASFSSTAARLGEQIELADASIATEAALASDLAARVADLNRQISAAEAGGGDANDLADERGRLIGELSEYVEVSVVEEGDGSVTLLVEGEALVQGGNARSLVTAADPTTGLQRIYLQGDDGSRTDLTDRVRSGSIGAAIELRDERVPELLADLDQLAYDLAVAANGVHSAGYGLDGTTGRDLFEAPTSVDGAALDMRLSADVEGDPDALAAATDPAGLPGDGSVAAAIADLASAALVGGGATPSEALAGLVARIGSEASGAYAEAEQRQLAVDGLQAQRDATSGVSMEEEAVNLIRFQDAYEASARVLSTIQEMLDTLLQL